jgi:hypothetical protein
MKFEAGPRVGLYRGAISELSIRDMYHHSSLQLPLRARSHS